MALVVEDGSGLSTAEAFASVAEADAYWALRGVPSAWSSSTTAQKEEALRLAAAFLETEGHARWKGTRYSAAQRLAWPRDGVYVDGQCLDRAVVPRALKEANIEAALRSRTATAGLVPDETEVGIASESVTVGPITESKSYRGEKSAATRYEYVDRLLAPLLRTRGQMDRA